MAARFTFARAQPQPSVLCDVVLLAPAHACVELFHGSRGHVGRLQLRARPQLMRATDEADAPATTPATQVVRRDLGAYVGLTSIVAVVPAVDWAGLGPETSNVARLLYFSAVALGSRCTSASNGKTSVSRRPSRLAPPPLSPGADWHFKWQAKKKKEGTLAVHDKQGPALSKKIRRGDGSLV